VGWPPDEPALVAAAVALFLVWRGHAFFAALLRIPRRVVVALVAVVAALLSAGYVQHYLRGGPRVIDATSYWLEARALAEGHLSWPIQEPTASVRGRFLLMSGPTSAPRLGVIFPPGYPVVLALGFLFHHPLWVGPIIAGLLVVATYALARRVAGRDDVALLAALFSALCAALRYHTADTMSHGWAALLWAATLVFTYGASDVRGRRAELGKSALAGLAAGWLFATRPVSALALVPVLAFAAMGLRPGARLLLAVFAAPPLLFFFFQQHAVTGSYFTWSQAAYYALADGPPGCFRYGFGAGVGCLHEHGEYVAAVLPHGFGWWPALLTSLRRLHMHLLDVANAEPLSLFTYATPWLCWRWRATCTPGPHGERGGELKPWRVLSLALAIPSMVLAYVPFYFDGSYPGGGARFFVDVLPLEHVLLAVSVALVAERVASAKRYGGLNRWAGWACALFAGGFAARTAFEHLSLRDREGGRPFFEPSVLEKAGVDHGLLFTGTDHAFNLAYDPNADDARKAIVVAREYGDDRDRLIWERWGRPPAYRYLFDGREVTSAALVPWSAGPTPHPYRYEAEAEWPPLAQSGGHFDPIFARGTCAWGGRLLAVRGESNAEPFRGSISFPVPFASRFRVAVHLASRGEVVARLVLRTDPQSVPIATWAFAPSRRDFACATLSEVDANLSGHALLEVTARPGGDLSIDAIALEPVALP
jgi:hypothetical protein